MWYRADTRLIGLGMLGLLSGAAVSWVASHAVVHPSKIPDLPIDLLVGWSFVGSVRCV